MTITHAKLKTTECQGLIVETIELTINGVKWGVPKDPANAHYQQYLEWVAEGNTPEPADSE